MPSPVGASRPDSITPAVSHSRIIPRAGNAPIAARSGSCAIESNAPARSASKIHRRWLRSPHSVLKMASIASWQPRPDRKPYE